MIKRQGNKLQVGRLIVIADRWPWQGYGWSGINSGGIVGRAPMNVNGARFGAGWRYRLGIAVGSTTVMVDLLFGMLRFSWERKRDA